MLRSLDRYFWLIVSACMLCMTALQIGSMMQESSIFDEGIHLTSGYRYLRTGHFLLNPEHPPFQNVLNAAPVLLLNPPLPTDEKVSQDQLGYLTELLYRGPIHVDKLLFAARLSSVALSALLILVVAWATRRFFGAPAAILAATLCSLDPNIIAHGRYVTTDISCTVFYLLTGTLWISYLRNPTKSTCAFAGLSLGLALVSKFSMVVLVPLLPILLIVHAMVTLVPFATLERRILAIVFVYITAVGVIAIVYLPDTMASLNTAIYDQIPAPVIPFFRYIAGIGVPLLHQKTGHASYLLGTLSSSGWWYYFPFVFAVKSPVGLLLLFSLAIWGAIRRLPRMIQERMEASTFVLMLLPALVYFSIVLISNINIGIRHILPIFPYLYVVCSAVLARVLPEKKFLATAGLLIALQATESLAIYPDYLAFFNFASGGPKAGPGYLLDSNLDWGQDLKKLKTYIDTNKPQTLCLDYFGFSDPKYYGVQSVELPKSWEKDKIKKMDCIAAISVTVLKGLYREPGSYDWLGDAKPFGMVGKSIYLYDFRMTKQR